MFDLKNLNDEYFLKLDTNEILEIKDLGFDDKVKCFEYFLTHENINNTSIIINIFYLINGINAMDEIGKEDKRLFFNNLEEYVDIKLAIKDKLTIFSIKLVENYLGVIKGLDTKLPELKVKLPSLYFCVLSLLSPVLLSKLFNKYMLKINLEDIKPVFQADIIYNKINSDNSLIANFIYMLANGESSEQ